MPRKTPVRELQKEEPVPSSPLRRSSRISNSSPAPTKVLTRRNSSSETTTSTPKVTRGRRSSLSQESESSNDAQPEKKKPTSTIKTRRSSLSSNADDEESVKTRSKASSVAKEQTSDVKKTTRRSKSVTEESETNEETKEKTTRSRTSSLSKKIDSSDSKSQNEKSSASKNATASSTPIKKSVPSDNADGTLESIEEISKETDSPGSATSESVKKRRTEGGKVDFDLSVINEASLTEEEISPKKVAKTEEQVVEKQSENETKLNELAEKDKITSEVDNKSPQKVTTNKSDETLGNKETATTEKETKMFDSTVSDSSFNLQLSPTVFESSNNETNPNDDKENVRPNEKPTLQEPEPEPMDVDEPSLQDLSPAKTKTPKSTKISLAKKVTEVQQADEKITHEIDEFLKEEVRFSVTNRTEEKLPLKVQNEVWMVTTVEKGNELPTENTKKSPDVAPKSVDQAEIAVDSVEAESKQSVTEHHDTSEPVLEDKDENEVSSTQETMDTSVDSKMISTTSLEPPKDEVSQICMKPNSPEKQLSSVSNDSTSQKNLNDEPLLEDVNDTNTEFTTINSDELTKSSSSPEQTEPQVVPQITEERLLESDEQDSASNSFETMKPTGTITTKLKTPEDEPVSTQIEVEDSSAQVHTVEKMETNACHKTDVTEDSQQVISVDESTMETDKAESCDSLLSPTKDKDDIPSSEIETQRVVEKEEGIIIEESSDENLELEVTKIDENKKSATNEKTGDVLQNSGESESDKKSSEDIVTYDNVSDAEINTTNENQEKKTESNEDVESTYCIPSPKLKTETSSTLSSEQGEENETLEQPIDEEVMEHIAQEVISDAKVEDLRNDKSQPNVQNDGKENEEDELNTTTEEKSVLARSFRRRSVDRTSITLQETVKAGDEKDKSVSERIHKVVDLFCAGLKNKADVSINVSLEYVGQVSDLEDEKTDVLEVSLTASDITEKGSCDQRRSKRRKICKGSELESPKKQKNDATVADDHDDDDDSVNSETQEDSELIENLLSETLQDDSDVNDVTWGPDKVVNDSEADDDTHDSSDEEEELAVEKDLIIEGKRTKRKSIPKDSKLRNSVGTSPEVASSAVNDKKVKVEETSELKSPKKLGMKEKSSAGEATTGLDGVSTENKDDSDSESHDDEGEHNESFVPSSQENSIQLKTLLNACFEDSDINDMTWGPDEEEDSTDSDSYSTGESDVVDEEPIIEKELLIVEGKRIRRKTDNSELTQKDEKNSRKKEDKNDKKAVLEKKNKQKSPKKLEEKSEVKKEKEKSSAGKGTVGTDEVSTGNGNIQINSPRKLSKVMNVSGEVKEDSDSHDDDEDESFISDSQEDSMYLSKLLSASLQDDSDGNDTTWRFDEEKVSSSSDSDGTHESDELEDEPIEEKELIVETKRTRRKADNKKSPRKENEDKNAVRMTPRVSFSEVNEKKVTPEKSKLKSPKNKKQKFLDVDEVVSHTEDVDYSSPKKKMIRTPYKPKPTKVSVENEEGSDVDEEYNESTSSQSQSHLKKLLGQTLEDSDVTDTTWKLDEDSDTDDTNESDHVEENTIMGEQIVEGKKLNKKRSISSISDESVFERPDKKSATKKDKKRKLFHQSIFNMSEAFASSELEESMSKKQKKKSKETENRFGHGIGECDKKQKLKKSKKKPVMFFSESEPMKYMHPQSSELGKKNKKRKLPKEEDTQNSDTVEPKKKTVRDLREKLSGQRQKGSVNAIKPSRRAPFGWSVTIL